MFGKVLQLTFLLSALEISLTSQPLMLQAKQDFIDKLQKTNLAVFFYGNSDSQEYQAFEGILPSDRELFAGLEFYFIPENNIKISKRKNSLFIFRNIEGNQWLTYEGPMQTNMMSQFLRDNCFDTFPQITGEQVDDMFVNKKNGFILLDFGQFQLLATKILLNKFCKEKGLMCGKCGMDNPAVSLVVQLMRADDEFGIAKLAYWDSKTQKFEIYTKSPLQKIIESDLVEIVSGREGLIKANVTPVKPAEDDDEQEL